MSSEGRDAEGPEGGSSNITEEEVLTGGHCRRRRYDDAFHNSRSSEDIDDDDSLEEHIIPQPSTTSETLSTTIATATPASVSTEGGEKYGGAEELPKVIPCGVHTCFQTFTTLNEYSQHYNRRHMHVCAICKKSLPTSHFLELHVLELHDTYFSIMAQKKPMFECLLETCKEKFQDVQQRKTHCLDVHKFPDKFQYWEFVKHERKPNKGQHCKSTRKGQFKKVDIVHQPTSQSSDSSSMEHSQEKDSEKASPEEVLMTEENKLSTRGKENSCIAFTPTSVRIKHLTFGRSTPKVFNNKYSFGLPKNPEVVPENAANGVSPTEDKMDLTDVHKALGKIV